MLSFVFLDREGHSLKHSEKHVLPVDSLLFLDSVSMQLLKCAFMHFSHSI